MAEVNTLETTADNVTVSKVRPVKKVAKKTAPKKAVKKVAKKATKKTTAAKAPRAKKEGLRAAQVRILHVLGKAKQPLTKVELAEKAETDPTKMGVFVGPRDGESKTTSERWPFPGLYELGYVKVEQFEEYRGQVVTITAKGRKALEDLKAAK